MGNDVTWMQHANYAMGMASVAPVGIDASVPQAARLGT
jgi:hypothetical protein